MTYTPLSGYKRTLADLMVKTRIILGDPSGERWSDTRVIEALNFAALEFAVETECIKDEIEVQTLENQWVYDLIELIEANGTAKPYGWISRVGYSGTQSPALQPSTIHVRDISGMPSTTAGTSSLFHLDMLNYGEVGILPIPGEDGETLPADDGNLQVTYVAMPEQMVNTTDYPDASIAATFHQYLPSKAASFLQEEGDEEDLALSLANDANFKAGCYEAVSDQYLGQTGYSDMRPM